MARKRDHGKTASGKPITDDLIDELAAKAEADYVVEGTALPDGYLLPEGTTLADVRQLDRELLASEGLDPQVAIRYSALKLRLSRGAGCRDHGYAAELDADHEGADEITLDASDVVDLHPLFAVRLALWIERQQQAGRRIEVKEPLDATTGSDLPRRPSEC